MKMIFLWPKFSFSLIEWTLLNSAANHMIDMVPLTETRIAYLVLIYALPSIKWDADEQDNRLAQL
jgi:hypothetical protein